MSRSTGCQPVRIQAGCLCYIDFAGLEDEAQCAAYHPDGSQIAVGVGQDIVVLDVEKKQLTTAITEAHESLGVWEMTFGPDGVLATNGWDSTVRLWDLAEGKKLRDLAPSTPGGQSRSDRI